MANRTQRQTQSPTQRRQSPEYVALVMMVNSLRIVSERATAVGTSVPVRRDLADVEITDGLCDRSVSIQSYAAAVYAG